MAQQVSDLISRQPVRLQGSAFVLEAARRMRAANVGAVIVEDAGHPPGIVTERDIVTRTVADGRDPSTTPLSDVCSRDAPTLRADADLDHAVQQMREQAIREALVVDEHGVLGIVSLAQLAIERDSGLILEEIHPEPANE